MIVSTGLADILVYPFAASGRLPPRLMKPLVAALPSRIREGMDSMPLPRVECSSLAIVKTIVAGSDAVGLFPLSAVFREVTTGELAVLDRVEPWLHTNFCVVWPRRRVLSPSARAFIEHMVDMDAGQFALENKVAATVMGPRVSRGRRRASK